MQIHELASLGRAPVAADMLAIDTGSTTNRVTYSAFKSGLNLSPALYFNTDTWADIYAQLTSIPNPGSATFFCNGPQSRMTGGAITTLMRGVVNRSGTTFDFVANAGGVQIINWRISDLSSSGGTVGSIYSAMAFNVLSSDASDWPSLYSILKNLSDRTLPIYLSASATQIATNGKVNLGLYGTVKRIDNQFSFSMAGLTGQYIYQWTITSASASARTTGTVYRFTGTAI